MNNHAIRIARLTDDQIVDLITTFLEKFEFCTVTIGFGAGAIERFNQNSDISSIEEYRGDLQSIMSFDVHLSRCHLVVYFRRGTCPNSENFDANRQASPYFDELILSAQASNVTADSKAVIRCVKLIRETLPIIPRTLAGQGQDVVNTLRAEMSALNEMYRNMIKEISVERIEFRKAFDDQRKSVEDERRSAIEIIRKEARDRERKFEDRMKIEEEEISKRQRDLDARQEELDDRQHMHVRRELREKIIDEFKLRSGRPVVSKSAGRMRWAVFLMTLLAGIGLTGFGLWTFYLLVSTDFQLPSYWLLVGRASILSIGGVGLFFYAVRWLRNIYLDDVRMSRHYDNYRDDIDRASFAIETVMEFGREKEGLTAPEAWIEGVCRNLFRSDFGDQGKEIHQSDALVELLKSISSASVGPNGARVRLDRRGSRRLANRMSKGSGQ